MNDFIGTSKLKFISILKITAKR